MSLSRSHGAFRFAFGGTIGGILGGFGRLHKRESPQEALSTRLSWLSLQQDVTFRRVVGLSAGQAGSHLIGRLS